MIADKELRNLFKLESEERLQHLDNGLLRLEKAPADLPLLEELFREAHSLKGAARMLGLVEIQNLAHQLEDAMGAAKKGEMALQPDTVADMYRTLETIRGLVKIEVGDAGAEERLPGMEPGPAPPQGSHPEPAAPVPPPSPATTPPRFQTPKAETFRIETIRVDPRRLDALLTQAGELKVTKNRIARRVAEIDELLDYYDERGRLVHAGRGAGGQSAQQLESPQEKLRRLRSGVYEDSERLDFIADQLESGIRAMRLLPMSTLFMLFPRLVHDLARDQRKEVELVIEGDETVADKRILEEMKDPLMHILRNAVDHGIESPEQRERAGKPRSGTVHIRASQLPASIVIEIGDDGRGLDAEAIRRTALKRGIYNEEELAGMSEPQLQSLILASGFSTSAVVTDVSGRGVGLDVVRNNVERLKGALHIESVPGRGLTLRLQLPISLATARVLIVAMSDRRYALPVEYVQFSRKVAAADLYTMEGRQTVSIDDRPVSVASLDTLLGIAAGATAKPQSSRACVILSVGDERFGLLVDELVDEMEVVLKPQGKLLKRVRNVSGATILDTGDVCSVLNPHDLIRTLRKASLAAVAAVATVPRKKVLLLAEDSITTRTQEKRILEGAGYEVVTAVDGADAYAKLGTRAFDAVVSDITMPNMDGLALTEKIRADKKYAALPVILVTTLASEDDRRRGLEAGANAYLTKPSFDQRVLLDCLARLI